MTKTTFVNRSVFAFALSLLTQIGNAQSSILNTNLIVNGDAEAGSAGTTVAGMVSSIPSWQRSATGVTNVVPYTLTGYIRATDPGSPTRAFQYFVGAGYPGATTLTQTIDVSSGAATISAGNVKFIFSGFIGSTGPTDYFGMTQVAAAFENANGQTFSTINLGPLSYGANGMIFQQQIGLLPVGTVKIVITMSFIGINGGYGAADDLSLVLKPLGTSPSTVLGSNLVVNGNAEAGPGVPSDETVTQNVPGWPTTGRGTSVCSYGGIKCASTSTPAPSDSGVNVFCGGPNPKFGTAGTMYQDIDVSPAATLIDASKVTFEASAWLGSWLG
jgi:hypothetical protein